MISLLSTRLKISNAHIVVEIKVFRANLRARLCGELEEYCSARPVSDIEKIVPDLFYYAIVGWILFDQPVKT